MGRFRRDDRGTAAVLTAVCGGTLALVCAVGVDLGNVFLGSRRLQGMADLAAMAAVQGLDSGSARRPGEYAERTVGTANWSGVTTATAPGLYRADPNLATDARFSAGAADPNAVRVTLRAPVPLYFAGLLLNRNTVDVARTATAARTEIATIAIGSRLATVDGGVANAMMSGLTGSSVNLSVMDYDALATARVDVFSWIDAVRTRASLRTLTFSDTLRSEITAPAALRALADVLTARGANTAAAAATALAAASSPAATVRLGSLIDPGPYGGQDGLSAIGSASVSASALAVTQGVLTTANGSRQLQLDLGSRVPGLADADVWLAIGERPNHSPWMTVARDGSVIVRTAQARLFVRTQVAASGLPTPTVTLPMMVELASAEARLDATRCPPSGTSGQRRVDLLVTPSLGSAAVADVDPAGLGDFTASPRLTPAAVVSVPTLRLTGYAKVDIGGGPQGRAQSVRFQDSEIGSGTPRSVWTSDIAQASTASLFRSLDLRLQTLAGPVALNGSSARLVTDPLLAAAPGIDRLIAQLSSLTGAKLGGADVWVDGLRCGSAALVG